MLLTMFNTQLAAFGRYARRSSRPSAATLTVRNTLTSPTHMPPVSTLGHIELCVEQISYLLWVSTAALRFFENATPTWENKRSTVD